MIRVLSCSRRSRTYGGWHTTAEFSVWANLKEQGDGYACGERLGRLQQSLGCYLKVPHIFCLAWPPAAWSPMCRCFPRQNNTCTIPWLMSDTDSEDEDSGSEEGANERSRKRAKAGGEDQKKGGDVSEAAALFAGASRKTKRKKKAVVTKFQ